MACAQAPPSTSTIHVLFCAAVRSLPSDELRSLATTFSRVTEDSVIGCCIRGSRSHQLGLSAASFCKVSKVKHQVG